MAETETTTSNHLLSALRPRSLASEAVLLCWIAWFVFGWVVQFFELLAGRDIYSAVLDAPFVLLESVIVPAIVYGLILVGGTVRRGADLPLSSSMEESVPAHDLMRRGRIVRGFVRIFPRLTAVLTGKQIGTRAAAAQAGTALDAKRVAAAWLLGGVVPLALGHVFYRAAPLAASEYGPFFAAFLDVCAVLFCLWRWPRVFGLSRLRPRVSDLAVGVLGGYLCFNVLVLIPALPIASPLATTWAPRSYSRHLELLFVCHVLVVPAAEELISRGVILASLCKRMPVPWAVLITSIAATLLHLPPSRWSSTFVAWLIFCGIYLARRRSIPASIAAHAVTNALVWWPNLVVADHFLK